MNIIQVYKKFPTQESCMAHLEQVRWKGKPVCPYCKSDKQTLLPKKHHRHCNTCDTSYNVTTGTLFYKSKIDLQKWFLAISIVLNTKNGVSIRELSQDIKVTKDTAWYMI